MCQQKNQESCAHFYVIGSALKPRTFPRNLQRQHVIVYIQRKDTASYGSCWRTICQLGVGSNWTGCPIKLPSASRFRQWDPFPDFETVPAIGWKLPVQIGLTKSPCFNAGCTTSCVSGFLNYERDTPSRVPLCSCKSKRAHPTVDTMLARVDFEAVGRAVLRCFLFVLQRRVRENKINNK